jgi:hypothetical protein
MTIVDLLWALPLLFAISLALGTAGRRRPSEIFLHVRRSFLALTLGLAMVGIAIRAVVTLFV